jgi:ubiquinone/menaquinone biosynthesis C-methylase UbiE
MGSTRTRKAPRTDHQPKRQTGPDLFASAFGNADAAEDTESFVSRLGAAAAQLKQLKRFSFELLQLKPGSTALDVGCGTGDDLRELATAVGPEGLAIGVDSNREAIAEARRSAANANLELEFVVGDVERLDLAAGSFDACRADLLFHHVTEPGRALGEMVRVANRGAVVEVIDRDWGLVAVDGADRPTTRAILDHSCDRIANGWIGRRLPALFRDCGLRDVRTRATPIATGEFAIADAMLDLEAAARRAAQERIVSRSAAEGWLRDLRRRDRRRRFFACWVMFVVTGRKRE